MARIRTVKPEFWTSDQIVDCSPMARLFFIGLWNFCDDGGVHPNTERSLKAKIFPGDDDITSARVRGLIDELIQNDLIGIYEADGAEYIHVFGWSKHQRVDRPNYKHPKPPKDRSKYTSRSARARRTLPGLFDDQSPPEGNGREWNGRESIGRSRSIDEPDESEREDDARDVEPDPDIDALFDRWYPAFPRKAGKGQARRAFTAALGKATIEVLVAGAERYAAERANEDPKYTKHPATWLNGECWLDGAGDAAPSGDGLPTEPMAEQWRARYRSFKARGTWLPSWGDAPPKPGEARSPRCQVPQSVIDDVDLEIPPEMKR